MQNLRNPAFEGTADLRRGEITEAMVRDGVAALEGRLLEGCVIETEWFKADLVKDVFRAMLSAQNKSHR